MTKIVTDKIKLSKVVTDLPKNKTKKMLYQQHYLL